MATLIKTDKNGTKYWRGLAECDRCGGEGYYAIGVNNGKLILSPVDGGVCFKCGGRGKIETSWKEYTPEHEAKLEAQRQRRAAKRAAEIAEKVEALDDARKKREEEAQRLEAEEKARKAISQWVGTVGDKIEARVEYLGTASFDVPSFRGFGTDTIHIHRFRDADGALIIWKSSSWSFNADQGDTVTISGTVKEHGEYKGEKQTILTRCRIKDGAKEVTQ